MAKTKKGKAKPSKKKPIQVKKKPVKAKPVKKRPSKQKAAEAPVVPIPRPPLGRLITLKGGDCMTREAWERDNKPNWWARTGMGNNPKFLRIPQVPGCKMLNVPLNLDAEEIPPDTVIYIGVGWGPDGVRKEIVAPPFDLDSLYWMLPDPVQAGKADKYGLAQRWEWKTRCRRYRVGRSVSLLSGGEHYYYAQAKGHNLTKLGFARVTTLAEAFNIIHTFHKKHYNQAFLDTNQDEVMEFAKKQGLDRLPAVTGAVEQVREVVSANGEVVQKVVKVPSGGRKFGEPDRFGSKMGTNMAKLNAQLSATPRTIRELTDAAGLVMTLDKHMKKLVESGMVVMTRSPEGKKLFALPK